MKLKGADCIPPEETKQKVRLGDLSIDYAYKSIKRAQDHKAENIPKLPQG
jgi:hypothetical protein